MTTNNNENILFATRQQTLESFDDWLDDIDVLSEAKQGLNNVLTESEISALTQIKASLWTSLSEKPSYNFPIIRVGIPLIKKLWEILSSFSGMIMLDGISYDEYVCINDIHGKLSCLLRNC